MLLEFKVKDDKRWVKLAGLAFTLSSIGWIMLYHHEQIEGIYTHYRKYLSIHGDL